MHTHYCVYAVCCCRKQLYTPIPHAVNGKPTCLDPLMKAARAAWNFSGRAKAPPIPSRPCMMAIQQQQGALLGMAIMRERGLTALLASG